jgi:hypothetical protein
MRDGVEVELPVVAFGSWRRRSLARGVVQHCNICVRGNQVHKDDWFGFDALVLHLSRFHKGMGIVEFFVSYLKAPGAGNESETSDEEGAEQDAGPGFAMDNGFFFP